MKTKQQHKGYYLKIIISATFLLCHGMIFLARGNTFKPQQGVKNSSCTIFGIIEDTTFYLSNESAEKLIKLETNKELTESLKKLLSPKPVSNISIRLKGGNIEKEVLSDQQGKFEFLEIPPGVYEISTSTSLHSQSNSEDCTVDATQTVDTSKSQHIKFILNRDRISVKGKITESTGKPISNTIVTGLVIPSNNSSKINEYICKTDSKGFFEITNLNPPNPYHIAGYLNGGNPRNGNSPFFMQIVCVNNSLMGKTEIPLITENLLLQSRALLEIMRRLELRRDGNTKLKENCDVVLPKSKGDVIFLPDIILDDDKPKSPSQKTDKQSSTEK